jgi:phosphopantothenoylcysteine decarboxylase/phosphopantothenate--cysteine ligase
MACGESGKGRLPEWERVSEHILRCISPKDLAGQRVLVTAGPTREIYDPVRFLSNRSSGKMGYALARSAFRRGADVTLISGPTAHAVPEGVAAVFVSSAQEMYDTVMSLFEGFSIIVKSAAVSDFRPVHVHDEKIKKDHSSDTIALEPTKDILKELGSKINPDRQLLVGFAAESSDIEAQARKKLVHKNLDLIAVNDITAQGSGFEGDSNQLTVISRETTSVLPFTTKLKAADLLWDFIIDNSLLKD